MGGVIVGLARPIRPDHRHVLTERTGELFGVIGSLGGDELSDREHRLPQTHQLMQLRISKTLARIEEGGSQEKGWMKAD